MRELLSGFKDWAFALPLFHILVSSFYLIGVTNGFGHNVGSFVNIDNIINVGIHKVAYVYLAMLVYPAFLMYNRYNTDKPYKQDVVNAITDDSLRAESQKQLDTERRVIFWSSIFLTLLLLFNVYRYYTQTQIISGVYIFFALQIPIAFVLIHFQKRYGWKNQLRDSLELMLFTGAFAYALGFTDGQKDLKLPYSMLDHSTECADGVKLRSSVGDFHIGVTPLNQRVILSNCDILFEIT